MVSSLTVLCGSVMLSLASAGFQEAMPSFGTLHRSGGRNTLFHVESQRNHANDAQGSPLTSTSLLMLSTYEQNLNAVHVADQHHEKLSQQIADLESSLEEQFEEAPIQVEGGNHATVQVQHFSTERSTLETELTQLQQEFQKAKEALEAAKEHERETLWAVQTEASKKVRAARSEGREVSEKVRIDLTNRLSTKERELLKNKINLAEKEDIISKWSYERASIKMLVGQAWSLVKQRSAIRGERLKAKAAEKNERRRNVFESEWQETRHSASSLARHTGQVVKSCAKITLLFTPFVGAKVLVASGAVFDRFGGDKQEENA